MDPFTHDLHQAILGGVTLASLCCCLFFMLCYFLLNAYEKFKRRPQDNGVSVMSSNIETSMSPSAPPQEHDVVVFFPQNEATEVERVEENRDECLPEVALDCDNVVRFYPQYSDDLPTYEEAVGIWKSLAKY